jgi:GntP family gluconate:H+ symporter
MLKTAQGSSTIASITTPTSIFQMIESIGLTSPVGLALTVLAIGAGAMTVSHANDSYFWAVSQFSDSGRGFGYYGSRIFTFLILL